MASAIIGSSGFIGSALLRFAENHLEEEWVGINRDNYSRWKNHPFSKVIWAAGSSDKAACNRSYNTCYDLNVHGLIRAFTDFPTMKFIYISSQAIYPPDCKDQSEKVKIHTNKLDTYGRMKYTGEELVQSRCPKSLIIRPNSFVGPGLQHNIIFDLVRDPQKPVYDSVTQFMHTDFFAFCVFALDRLVNSGIYNVTSSDPIHIDEVAEILDIKLNKIKQPTGENVPERRAILNTQKFEKLFQKRSITIPSSRDAVGKWNESLEICLPNLWSRLGCSSCK